MSTTTPNMGLFKYDPNADAALTFNIKQALNDNWDKIDAAMVKALANAETYDSSKTYALGDYCTKDGKLYKCTTAITEAEAWTADHWAETSMSSELTSLARQLSESGGLKLTKLWENASPKSAFAAQTVSLDLSAYHYVVIEDINLTLDSPLIVSSRIYKVGERSMFTGLFGTALSYRFFQTNENGITFNAGYRPSQDDNTRNVPYRIYGIVGLTIT